MPEINIYKCNACNFIFHEGWGGYKYVESDNGQRVVCAHPGENQTVERILNLNISEIYKKPAWWWSKKRRMQQEKAKQFVRNRTGFNSLCVCQKCKEGYYLDIGDAETAKDSWRYFYGATKRKDRRQCPTCGNTEIKTILELVNNNCPMCGKGQIAEIITGAMA